MPEQNSGPLHVWREQALSATVHRACQRCNAPGVWSSESRIKLGWPGCYVDPGDHLDTMPVGPMCPNCGADRNPSLWNTLGEIWRKKFTTQVRSK
jgi:rubredoxin